MNAEIIDNQAQDGALLYPDQLRMTYCVLDVAGKIQFITAHGAKLLRYSPPELIGRPLLEVLAPFSDHESAHTTLVWRKSDSDEYAEQDFELIHANGQRQWLRVTWQPVYHKTHEIQGFFIGLLDITTLKTQQSRYQELNDHVEHHLVERMVSLMERIEKLKQQNRHYAEFCQDVVHEIRTPLTSMILRLHLLEHGSELDRVKHHAVLRQQIHYLGQLIDDISSFVKVHGEQKPVLTPINLHQLLMEVVTAQRPRAEAKGLWLTTLFTEDSFQICGNAVQLAQVCSNLITNAINYTSAGTIQIVTELKSTTNHVKISVIDTGMGIPNEDMSQIFERFYRGRNVVQADITGTGLGLGIVREIIKAHHGLIEVHSQERSGTTVVISLPIFVQEGHDAF